MVKRGNPYAPRHLYRFVEKVAPVGVYTSGKVRFVPSCAIRATQGRSRSLDGYVDRRALGATARRLTHHRPVERRLLSAVGCRLSAVGFLPGLVRRGPHGVGRARREGRVLSRGRRHGPRRRRRLLHRRVRQDARVVRPMCNQLLPPLESALSSRGCFPPPRIGAGFRVARLLLPLLSRSAGEADQAQTARAAAKHDPTLSRTAEFISHVSRGGACAWPGVGGVDGVGDWWWLAGTAWRSTRRWSSRLSRSPRRASRPCSTRARRCSQRPTPSSAGESALRYITLQCITSHCITTPPSAGASSLLTFASIQRGVGIRRAVDRSRPRHVTM